MKRISRADIRPLETEGLSFLWRLLNYLGCKGRDRLPQKYDLSFSNNVSKNVIYEEC